VENDDGDNEDLDVDNLDGDVPKMMKIMDQMMIKWRTNFLINTTF